MVLAGKKVSKVVLVMGAEGMFGRYLCPCLALNGHKVLRQSRSKGADICFDPMNEHALRTAILDYRPDVIVNLIAESNVDVCQSDMRRAYMANVQVVKSLADAIITTASDAHFVQISTDHLYDGSGPHTEADVLPINAYALTKLTGELTALSIGATVIRTNFFGRSKSETRRSFTDWIVESLMYGKKITAFNDVRFSAMHMETLANCVSRVVSQRYAGVFNVGCHDGISKADFAIQFAAEMGFDKNLIKIGSAYDLKLDAPRPIDMTLDVSKFENKFDMKLPSMHTEILLAVQDYRRI